MTTMSTSNNYQMKDLHEMLFKQMERLDDPTCDLEKELKKAEAKMNIGKVIVDGAKAQVEYVKATGGGKRDGDEAGLFGTQKQLGNGSSNQ